MELRDLGRTLARWWYLTLAVILLAVAAGVGIYRSTGPTYEAESTFVLLPPAAVIEVAAEQNPAAAKNPLLYMATLGDARDMLVRALASRDAVDAIEKAAPNATVEAAGDPTSNSPLIIIKSEAETEADALRGIEVTGQLIPTTLTSIQDQLKIEQPQRISPLPVTIDSVGTPSHKKALQNAVIAFAGTSLLGGLGIALLDAIMRRRREGQQAEAEVVADEPTAVKAHQANRPATVSSASDKGATAKGKPKGR